jgi:TatD family-associated radical SAM protein
MYGNLYMNITGLCGNRCRFCIRDRTDGLGGYYLRHGDDPKEERLMGIVDLLPGGSGRELVFCGYGEPTMRPLLLRRLAASAAGKGYSVRLNTNGTCLLRMSREETLRMLEPFDAASVSLNASSEEEYERLCRPGNPEAWRSILEFLKLASGHVRLRATAVRYPGVDMDAVAALASSLGIPFRVR